MKQLISCLLIAVLTGAAASTPAVEIHVRPDGLGDEPTIQAALDAAQDGDVVVLADGVFVGSGNRDLDPNGKAVTIRSARGDPLVCVIDCQGAPGTPRRAFRFHSAEGTATQVEGVTLTGGYAVPNGGLVSCTGGSSPTFTNCRFLNGTAAENGGALYCYASDPMMNDCLFEGNTAVYYGGAVRCLLSSPRFERCVFRTNSVNAGPGICFYRDCEPTLIDCLFEDNDGTRGGGVYAYDSVCTLIRCQFVGNAVLAEGGAIIAAESQLVLEDCTFTNNSAGEFGGAIFSGQGSLSATGCIFDGNTSPRGGALHAQFAAVSLAASTLARNEATVIGSGVSLLGSTVLLDRVIVAFGEGAAAVGCADPDSLPRLFCCDVFGHDGGDWVGCLEGQLGQNGNLAADPQFCDLAAGDLTLHVDSPCAPDQNPLCGGIGALPTGCGGVTDAGPLPVAAVILRAHPNPFNPAVTVEFSLERATTVRLRVLAANGSRVRTLIDGTREAGDHSHVWDGRDDSGRPAASGTYFLQLVHGGRHMTLRVALVR